MSSTEFYSKERERERSCRILDTSWLVESNKEPRTMSSSCPLPFLQEYLDTGSGLSAAAAVGCGIMYANLNGDESVAAGVIREIHMSGARALVDFSARGQQWLVLTEDGRRAGVWSPIFADSARRASPSRLTMSRSDAAKQIGDCTSEEDDGAPTAPPQLAYIAQTPNRGPPVKPRHRKFSQKIRKKPRQPPPPACTSSWNAFQRNHKGLPVGELAKAYKKQKQMEKKRRR